MIAILTLLLPACGPGISPEQATEAVMTAATQANPAGRMGVELLGRSRWVKGEMFDPTCLMSKDLAFVDDPKAISNIRISPTWDNQAYLTGDTPMGWCALLGEGATVELSEPELVDDAYLVRASFSMAKPTPWFECLADKVKTRDIFVRVDENKQPVLDGDLALPRGECPLPMPAGEERAGTTVRPTKAPPKSPGRQTALTLMKEFDQALWDKDRLAALELVSCHNPFAADKKYYGSCTPAELLQVGPHPRGEERLGDGNPWLEYTIADFDDIGRMQRDKRWSNRYHVLMTHKRSGRDRSFAMEWADGKWKLVGVVGALGADLTSLRFVYDLHRADKSAILDKRLEGEEIDEAGNPLDPLAEEGEEGSE